MAAHAKLGPSGADRWMNCTASVELIDRLVAQGAVDPNQSSVYADEGTAAHTIRERCLRDGTDPHTLIGTKIEVNGVDYECTDEMADCLQPGIDWIRGFTDTPDVEIRVDLSPWLPGQFGTMDGGWILGDTLFASDLKYGAGEDVSPVKNKQQMLYALGYWHFKGRPSVEKVVICIDQPRLGGLKFWECTIEELLAFAEEVAAAYAEIISGNTKFSPTEKGCRWCSARDAVPAAGYTGCAAYNQWVGDFFMAAFDDLDAETPTFTNPNALSPEKRFYIVRHASLARKWLQALQEASLAAALGGNPDPGSKLVVGPRSDRFFTDERAAELLLWDALGDGAYKPAKIIGIPDAEKALKPGKRRTGDAITWAAVSALIDQKDGAPTLAPEDDPRPAIANVADAFDEND